MMARVANPGKAAMKKKRKKKKNPHRRRSAAQRAATKRMIAMARHKHHARKNPRRKKSKHRRRNPAPMILASKHHRRRRRRRRNPDMLRMAWDYGKPAALAALAATIGLGGSFAIARHAFKSRQGIIAASLAAGVVGGVAVGLIDPAAGLVTAMPFMVTAGQNVLAGSASVGGGTATSDAVANLNNGNPNPPKAISGLGDRLLAGRTIDGVYADDLAGTRRLEGVYVDDLSGIEADNLEGIFVEDM